MNIQQAIMQRKIQHVEDFGKYPSTVYLGRDEYNQLTNSLKYCLYFAPNIKGKDESFDGMNICRVLKDSHLQVA